MALGRDFPVSETLGVFFSVAGVDWLADGYAEPLKAVIFAISAGTALYLARQWIKRHRK